MAEFSSINARLSYVNGLNSSFGRRLSDSTVLVRMFDDLSSGFVNSAAVGGSTVLFKDTGEMLDGGTEFSYGIHGTPIVRDLCTAINLLERSKFTMLTPSGLASLTSVLMALVKPGDHVLIADTVYEPLRDFCRGYLKALNVLTDFYDPADEQSLKSLLKPNTKLVHLESPGSGTFEMQDVKAVCKHVHSVNANCFVSMDNTWATPLLFKPILHGVDVSVHALTKYPSGASDLMMGSVSVNERSSSLVEAYKVASGVCASSCDSYSVLKGLKSLSARLAYHHESALKIASYLRTVKGVVKILCPALPEFPYYYLWKRDYTLANGVLSFVLECPDQTMRLRLARRYLDALKIFGLGWSWGGYKSLAAPVKLSHRLHAPEFGGPVIRLQVGLESVDDLVWDLEKGFKAL